ncbi:MAG: hypothetical protein JRH11_06135 [Deltaproteobacteria bacterium]|nr:hypothetical protein [Deltaproteobacteria bacterium]
MGNLGRMVAALSVTLMMACSGGDEVDAGMDSATDTGRRDTGAGDTGSPDTSTPMDTGMRDASPDDTGAGDAGDPGDAGGATDGGGAGDGGDAGSTCGAGATPTLITGDGTVATTSVFGGTTYPGGLAVDGMLDTSWFSIGSADVTPTFTWTVPADACIRTIEFINNVLHTDPSFRTDFGFNTVTIEIRDTPGGAVVWTDTQSLAGRPDPDITVTPGGVTGREIALIFAMHDDVRCGGFSELNVTGLE